MQTIDNRGLACPEPVIRTKRALEALTGGTLVSIVDNLVAKENVLRLVHGLKLQAETKEEQGLWLITISKGEPDEAAAAPVAQVQPATALLVLTDQLGTGSEQLGQVLMKSYFYALAESDQPPASIWFMNSGVKLTCQGSPILERLERLESRGAQIMSCGTCLDFYQLQDQLTIGKVTNMYAVVEAMQQASKTITLG